MARREIEIINRLGLHARAAAKLVSCATGFMSRIELERNGQRVNGKSIMGVMMLAASRGSRIVIDASGEDEEAALGALEALIGNRFGETECPSPSRVSGWPRPVPWPSVPPSSRVTVCARPHRPPLAGIRSARSWTA